MGEIERKVFEIYKLYLKQLSEEMMDTNLESLGLDSIMFIEIVVLIEEEFKITLKDEQLLINNFNTINKAVNIIKQYL